MRFDYAIYWRLFEKKCILQNKFFEKDEETGCDKGLNNSERAALNFQSTSKTPKTEFPSQPQIKR